MTVMSFIYFIKVHVISAMVTLTIIPIVLCIWVFINQIRRSIKKCEWVVGVAEKLEDIEDAADADDDDDERTEDSSKTCHTNLDENIVS